MAIAFVQSTLIATATGFSSITTSAITTVSAHLLVSHIANYTSLSAITSDSKSNSWTNVAAFSTGSGFIRMDYVANCVGGASHTFTATGDYPSITVQEFSGVATTTPLDASGTDFVSGGATSHSVSCTTTNANDVLVGCCSSSNVCSFAVSSPFTQDRELDTSSNEGIVTGYNIVSSTGSQSFVVTTNTTCTTRSIIAAFMAATGAPTPPIGRGLEVNQAVKHAGFY
jgi:hypothetical protein